MIIDYIHPYILFLSRVAGVSHWRRYKIDVTAFMVWFIKDYPESFKEMKENPDIQKSLNRWKCK
jgi:hypothetical protein